MENVIKRIFVSVLIAVFLAIGVGCDCNKNKNENPTNKTDSDIFTPTEEEPEQTTDTLLLKNGISPYKIVIPENASSDVKFAADELQYFFSLPTGVVLPIVTDKVVGDDTTGRFLSVGDTIIAQAAGLKPDYMTLGTDGYRIKTYGNAVAMLGGGDTGTIFSVYGYIYKQFRLKIYAADCFTYSEVKDAELVDLDFTDIPDIAHRTGGTYFGASWEPWQITGDAARLQRSRYRMTCCWSAPYALMSHTHFTILPPDMYYEDHPDWYCTPDENKRETWQLDVSNQEMWSEFINRLKNIIDNGQHTGIWYYQLGVEDNANEPTTDKYLKLKEQLGGVASGVQLYFMNYVVQTINEWVIERYPDLHLGFSFFVYGNTFMPAPVKNTGTTSDPVYEPYRYTDPYDGQEKDLKPVDNLVPMVAPIMQHRSHGYLDDTNPVSKVAFEAWGALSKEMHVWAYETYFADYLAPFNEWGSFKQNYTDYKRLGVSWVFEEGSPIKTPNFMELRQYLMSQLMWDTTLDTETLIVDFMHAFYGDGWEDVYAYFNLMRYRLYEMEKVPTAERKYAYINDNLALKYEERTEWFPVSLLMQCETCLERALSKVEKDGYYYKNIECARIPNRYLLLNMYSSYFELSEYQAMVYDFKRVIEEYGADSYYSLFNTYGSLISGWLSKVA